MEPRAVGPIAHRAATRVLTYRVAATQFGIGWFCSVRGPRTKSRMSSKAIHDGV